MSEFEQFIFTEVLEQSKPGFDHLLSSSLIFFLRLF